MFLARQSSRCKFGDVRAVLLGKHGAKVAIFFQTGIIFLQLFTMYPLIFLLYDGKMAGMWHTNQEKWWKSLEESKEMPYFAMWKMEPSRATMCGTVASA